MSATQTEIPAARYLDRNTPPHITTLVLLAGVSALNMSIFLPSLNAMSRYFNVDYGVMLLAVSLYMAATAVVQLLIGPVADKYGRRGVMLWSLAAYIAASVGALMSTHIGAFLAFRMAQAAIASGLVLSRAVVRDMYPPQQAASMIGYVTMGMSLVPMVGPMVGGLLDEFYGWHATFLLLTVAGALTWVVCLLDMGETQRGAGLSFREQVRTYPELLRSYRFWGYVACMGFSAGAFYALLGGTSFVADTVFRLSPVWAGVALGAPAVGYTLGNYLSGRYSSVVGINRMALIGTIISAAGLGASALTTMAGLSHPLAFFGFCTFLGIGNGLTMPNTIAGSLSVRPELAGSASGLGGAIMIAFGAGLSAYAGSVLDEGTGELPLQIIMFATSFLAMLAIIFVILRERRIA